MGREHIAVVDQVDKQFRSETDEPHAMTLAQPERHLLQESLTQRYCSLNRYVNYSTAA